MKPNQTLMITGRADGLHDATWHEDGKIWTSQCLNGWYAGIIADRAAYYNKMWHGVTWTLVASRSTIDQRETPAPDQAAIEYERRAGRDGGDRRTGLN